MSWHILKLGKMYKKIQCLAIWLCICKTSWKLMKCVKHVSFFLYKILFLLKMFSNFSFHFQVCVENPSLTFMIWPLARINTGFYISAWLKHQNDALANLHYLQRNDWQRFCATVFHSCCKLIIPIKNQFVSPEEKDNGCHLLNNMLPQLLW